MHGMFILPLWRLECSPCDWCSPNFFIASFRPDRERDKIHELTSSFAKKYPHRKHRALYMLLWFVPVLRYCYER